MQARAAGVKFTGLDADAFRTSTPEPAERIKEMRGNVSQEGNVTAEIHLIVGDLFKDHRCKVTVETEGSPLPLSAVAQEETVWITREALTNAYRHSNAPESQHPGLLHTEKFSPVDPG